MTIVLDKMSQNQHDTIWTILNGAFPALIIFLLVGFTFWQENQRQKEPPKEEVKKETVQPGSISLFTAPNDAFAFNRINSDNDYLSKIAEIRRPVNATMEDLNQKTKYTKLFSKDQVSALINKARGEIKSALEKINVLKVSQKFSSAQEANVKSLNLMDEGLTSLQEFYETGDEAKLQLYNFKIEESNKIVQDLKMSSS